MWDRGKRWTPANSKALAQQVPAQQAQQAPRRLRMWLDLAAAGGLLLVWGTYFRTLLQL